VVRRHFSGSATVKVGVAIPQGMDLDGPSLRRFATLARELGFASLWVGDHIVFPAVLPREAYPYASGMHPGADLFGERSWTETRWSWPSN
jgi:alkanesulfonate monooxygenase SsuD/methylene tetrahydromethanopterin reductase-like flavin-dependent oxidoreductase (luciferase family)